jgi:hypothetical protein
MSGWVTPLLEGDFRAPKLLQSSAHYLTHLAPHVNASPAADAGN